MKFYLFATDYKDSKKYLNKKQKNDEKQIFFTKKQNRNKNKYKKSQTSENNV